MYMKTTKVSCKMTLKLIHWRELIFAFGKTLPSPILEWLWITDERKWQCHRISSPCWKCVFLHIYIDIKWILWHSNYVNPTNIWDMGHFYHQPLLSPFLLLFAPGSGRPALGCSLRYRWRWSTSHGPPQQALRRRLRRIRRILLSFWTPWNPLKKQLSWCECGNSMKFIRCFFLFFPAF